MKDVRNYTLGELETIFAIEQNGPILFQLKKLRMDVQAQFYQIEQYKVQQEAVKVVQARKDALPERKEKSLDETLLDECVVNMNLPDEIEWRDSCL